jgi:phenylalanyl-tRNA synthetase beta chain
MPAQVSRCLSNEPALLGDDGAFPIKIGACCAVSKVRVRCVRVCDKLSEDHGGLLELAAEAPGQNIREHSQFDDVLFTLKLTRIWRIVSVVYGVAAVLRSPVRL